MSDADLDLLRRFARDHAQDAFAELVQRHLNLVHSAALRQVRSPQLAEEVAQSVFCDLARNANKLCAAGDPPVLTAWLYQVTRYTAVDVVRKESRRQLREQIAVEMNAMNADAASWNQIEPLLDEAMLELDVADRDAVLLRFFENKSLREVGQQLGVSDDAAQKRVSRAVERLREYFSKRNVTIGTGGLTAIIAANAVQAAPVGLAVTISTAALAGTAAATSTFIATSKTIAMTTLQKIFITATVAVLAGAGVYEAKQSHDAHAKAEALKQQQALLVEQALSLQNGFMNATNRLRDLLAENSRLKSNPHEAELLKLRGEVGMLRQQTKDAEQKLAELTSATIEFEKHETAMVNNAKQIGLAFRLFAMDNAGLFPTNYLQITNELGGMDRMVNMDVWAYDFMNISPDGSVAGLNATNADAPQHADLIVLRERVARQSPDGSWKRVYCFVDGRVVTATTYDGNFAAWEKANGYSPPPGNE